MAALAAVMMMRRNTVVNIGTHVVLVQCVHAVAVIAERHALPRRHGRHALDGHDEGDNDGKKSHEPNSHRRILTHDFDASVTP